MVPRPAWRWSLSLPPASDRHRQQMCLAMLVWPHNQVTNIGGQSLGESHCATFFPLTKEAMDNHHYLQVCHILETTSLPLLYLGCKTNLFANLKKSRRNNKNISWKNNACIWPSVSFEDVCFVKEVSSTRERAVPRIYRVFQPTVLFVKMMSPC